MIGAGLLLIANLLGAIVFLLRCGRSGDLPKRYTTVSSAVDADDEDYDDDDAISEFMPRDVSRDGIGAGGGQEKPMNGDEVPSREPPPPPLADKVQTISID